jgi:beta-N-acetylhexosaminidase
LAAGCDLVLHCNGTMSEMAEIAQVVPALSAASSVRADAAEALRLRSRRPFDRCAAERRFDELVGDAGAAVRQV